MRWMKLVLVLPVLVSPQLRAHSQENATDRVTQEQRAGDIAAPVLSEALAAQVMLDRAGFSPGEIDGEPGANLKRALVAFQTSHDLTPTGTMDQGTRQRLQQEAGSQRPLTRYTITSDDAAGPFTPDIPADLVEQSKVAALDYRSLLESLGERCHTNPALLKTLNPSATFTKAGESLTVPAVSSLKSISPPSGVTVVVTKATSSLTLEDADHHVLFHAPVTTGSQHDPLPLGQWKVNGVQQDPQFHYNPALFWDANPANSKALLPPGPNNPVGTVWIDLSKEHYGIHGTPEPSKIGHVESHGCVRLTNWDAQRVAAAVKPGTTVVFR